MTLKHTLRYAPSQFLTVIGSSATCRSFQLMTTLEFFEEKPFIYLFLPSLSFEDGELMTGKSFDEKVTIL
jgi:hypothetical protein